MEVILFYITVTLMAVLTVINLVLPLSTYVRGRRLATKARRDAVKRLYGLHYQSKAFLMFNNG